MIQCFLFLVFCALYANHLFVVKVYFPIQRYMLKMKTSREFFSKVNDVLVHQHHFPAYIKLV